jgi:mono/diheme cytochrome c family protein
VLWAAALLGGAVLAGTPDPGQVAVGDQLYRQLCQRCHGYRLQSSGAASFDLRRFPANDPQRFHDSVMHGRNEMPAHDDILTDEDVEALFAYVVTTQQGLTR